MSWFDGLKDLSWFDLKKQMLTETKLPFMSSTQFYFANDNFDERNLKDFTDFAGKLRRLRIAGETFVLRQMRNHILFRREQSASLEDAFFLSGKLLPSEKVEIDALTAEDFAAEYRRTAYGRCVLYVDRLMNNKNCCYFFFNPDGSGFVHHYKGLYRAYGGKTHLYWETTDFYWATDERKAVIKPDLKNEDWQQIIMTADLSSIKKICHEIFESEINKRLNNPYIVPDLLQNIPVDWESGSESDLRTLTYAICCTEPGLFDAQQTVEVFYKANRPYKRGGFQKIKRKDENITNGRLTALCELAFRLNQFSGLEWRKHEKGYQAEEKPLNRKNTYRAEPHKVVVKVAPPSVHERAEAFLTLFDWLSDTLHDPTKQERLLLMPKS